MIKDINVLAIDPSGYYKNKKATIGVAFCAWEKLGERNLITKKNLKQVSLSQFVIEKDLDLEAFYSYLDNTLATGTIDRVIIEDYILYEESMGAQVYQQQPTSKTIGVIEHLCNKHNVLSYLQTAALVKLWTNKVLASKEYWQFLVKEKNSYRLGEFKVSKNRHAMDAFRHNFYWTLGENKKCKENKT